MSPTAKTPRTSRAERREALTRALDVALHELLAEEPGLSAIPVARLVQRAGVTRSVFYAHFEDLGELLVTLSVRAAADIEVAAQQWWAQGPTDGRAELEAALRALVEAYEPHRALFGALVELAPSDGRVDRELSAMVGRFIARLASELGAGQQRGVVDREIDPQRSAAWIGWTLHGGLDDILASTAGERLLGALADVIWKAIYRDARS